MIDLTDSELIDFILSIPGEDRRTEFKRMGGNFDVKRTMESIVALTNTDGGYMVFGVDDPEKTRIKGLDRVFGIEENLDKFDEIWRNIERIVPPTSINWPPRLVTCAENRTIGLLPIPKATDSFHSINNHVYIRLEKGNKLLTPLEIIKLSYAKGFHQADRELVDVDFDLLKTKQFEDWRKAREISPGDLEEILFHTGLARKDKTGLLKPTRAAVLLFALYPHNLMETKCTIRVFQYTGTNEQVKEHTLNLIGTPKTVDGPIIRQIKDAHDYVLTLLRAGMRIPASGFVTTYRIPERAVKEAITNAVIHRDYYQKRDIEVRIFEDKVEVESPGLFPSNITSYNIGFVRAESYRNDLLVKHLREFPDPPNLDRNEGIRAMRIEMERNQLYPPVFLSYPLLKDSVRVVLLNSKKNGEWDKVSDYLSNKEKYINNEKVRAITGNPDSSRVSRLLKKWVDQGLLIRIESGSKRRVKYRLPVDSRW
ncbi:MAG: putative DNA binding domain-containing protein [Candidatus Aminicenantes bacterium]|nr:MAG: putative DNA binding domain-containing protein [Candidatus Aminicenantes bacterium]